MRDLSLLALPALTLALAAPAGAQTADFPYFDGFEAGSLGPEWTITKPWGSGGATVTLANGPFSGSYHLILEGPASSQDSNVTADLRIDLAGESSVLLEFQVRDYGDEYATSSGSWLGSGSNYYDGVFISDDGGTSWYEVLPLDNTTATGTYQKHTIDLDAAVLDAGMSYTSDFIVRFSWEDEYAVPTDGFGFDEVTLRSLDYATIANVQSTTVTTNGRFGTSMVGIADVSGDGFPDLAVGHPGFNSGSGRVEIYSGVDGSFISAATPSISGDQFGAAIANIGDMNGNGSDDILIGAPLNDQNGISAGAAFFYDTKTGAQLRVLYGPEAGDEFGSALAALPDVTGDGRDELVVGSPLHDGPAGVDTGRVVVYASGNYAILLDEAGQQAGEKMGTSVDGFGDQDGDGLADVIVGSPEWDLVPFLNDNVGAAHVYSSATALRVRSFSGDFSKGGFGTAVLGLGDVTDDGVADWMVGAPDQAGTAGIVRFFSGADGSLLSEDQGKAVGEHFGTVLTRAGDMDGDGGPDVAAGSASSALGTVRVYRLPSLATLVDIEPVDSKTGFGRAIAGVGDLNLDGLGDIAVGSPDEVVSGSSAAGRVRVVSTADAPTIDSIDGLHSTLSGQAVIRGTNLLANLQVQVDGVLVPTTFVSPVEALVDLTPVEPGGFFDLGVASDLGTDFIERGLSRYPAFHGPSTAALGELVELELDNGEPGAFLLAFSSQKYSAPAPFEAWGWFYGLELNGVWTLAAGNFTTETTKLVFPVSAPTAPSLVGETFHLQAWTLQSVTGVMGFTDTVSVTMTN